MLFAATLLTVCLQCVWLEFDSQGDTFLFIIMSIMALEAIKFDLFLNSLHLFIFFHSFTLKNERSADGFSM